MKHKKPYSLYPRKLRNGKVVYYYRTYDQGDKRTSGKSTGETSRARAEQVVIELIKRGEIVPKSEMSFKAYSDPWWRWEQCPYLKSRVARGANISRTYADIERIYLDEYIIPYFGKKLLSRITPSDIEGWMIELKDKGLSDSTIHNAYGCLRIMLNEAERRELLHHNPIKAVKPFSRKSGERGIFTMDEVKALLGDEALPVLWDDNVLHFSINLAAASTGCRLGELQALRGCDIHDGYIEVKHSWDRHYGLKDTKNHKTRYVPIPGRTAFYLERLRGSNPEGFIFSAGGGERPIPYWTIYDVFCRVLSRAGIEEEERKERRLSFHSWRHWFNTLLRGKVPEVKLRMVTGHSESSMSDRYTHFNPLDYQEVALVQDEVFR